ncbi:MAG: hypothetical protein ACI9US_004594, partial [Gammaproteobacteria bacterium]
KLSVAGTDAVWLISANDLLMGGVVYLTPTMGWSRVLLEAFTVRKKSVALSQLASLVADQSTVIGHTLVEASLHADGTLSLLHYRDRIREGGPTRETLPALLNNAPPPFKAHELNTGKP